ncbi:MAG: 23S rRNA (adenine(2503)-C(2))-methyltransferase RlmN [Flammeovirgaceae bacterium]|jgi:23S rRNA (adenine2503-C2)-methyltransferase|nr:23S rRNA (adenine(2503)-C(2))-methyltransferase RlmN [Flammeovirgaceae bacterium]
MKQDVRKLTFDKLKDYVLETGLPAFRAKQIWEWIWVKSVHNFDEMSNLSLMMRAQLAEDFDIFPISLQTDQKSNDGTIKLAFALHDKSLVEGVLIPAEDRMTACVSSQVGCSLSCKFCATGYMDRKRNLDPAEIYDQVVEIDKQSKKHFDVPISNIVFMGMGEPLLNYKNLLQSIERITATDGLNMSPKRITVSTAGIAKMIIKLADDQVKFNLALSLHASNDVKRNQIMPINETNTLKVLKEALLYFYQKTGNQITFEYIVFDNFNDRIEDAEELWHFAKSIPSKINIIEYNPIAEAQYQNTTADKLEQFADFLKSKKLIVNIRRSRGKDIDAACGQLANKN